MNVPPRVTISAISLELKRLSHAYRETLSSLIAVFEAFLTDKAPSLPDDVLAGLETVEASLCKMFDDLVTISNSTIDFYHILVQRHGDCEQSIKELTASANSNIVTNNVQLLQNKKTRVERRMLEIEESQYITWGSIERVQFDYNAVVQMIKRAKDDRAAPPTQGQ